MKRLLAVLAVLLVAAVASAQPNLSYQCSRDSTGKLVMCSGLRPVVTAEMGIPPGTPFFDTSTFSMYYWSGSAWTATVAADPLLFQGGTMAAPGLAFASDPGHGFYRVGAGAIGLAYGGTLRHRWKSTDYLFLSDTASIQLGTASDLILTREAAATLQLGADAASAISQTFKGADSTDNGTMGGVLTIRGGAGTAGDAKGGNLNLAGGAAFGAGEQGVVAIVDTGTKPTCAAGLRGGFWYEQGGAGVADTFEVCAKAAAGDTYAWRTLATIP